MAVNKRLLQGAAAAGELVPSEHFGVVLYEGDGSSSHSINGGKFGAAGYFTNAGVVTIPSSVIDTNKHSLSVWFNTDATSGTQTVFEFNTGNRIIFRAASTDSNKANFGGGGWFDHGISFSANTWYHLVITFNSGSPAKIYVNGSLQHTTGNISKASDGSANYLGANNSSGGNNLLGKIDQFRVFQKELSSSEVSTLYAETDPESLDPLSEDTTDTLQVLGDSSCIATYRFENNEDDLSGNYDGTVSGGVQYAAGRYGQAIEFSSGHVNTGHNFSLANNSFSFSFWFANSATGSTNSYVISTDSAESTNNKLLIGRRDSNGKLNFAFYANDLNSATDVTTDGTWQHWVCTYNASTNSRKIYLNGSLDASDTASADYQGTGNVEFGFGIYQAYGKLDQVRIFNKEISAAEVTTLYNENSLVASYRFEGNANDDTRNYDGTASNVTYEYGLNFTPDFVWLKNRSSAYSHILVDSTRGRAKSLLPNDTTAELTSNTGNDFVSFDTGGFTVGTLQQVYANVDGDDYVAWCLKANGGTTSSNTDGTITSTVQVNEQAGFSIVSYTGNGTASSTIGHGLSEAPDIVLVKATSAAYDWQLFSKEVSTATYPTLNGRLALHSNAAAIFDGYTVSVGASTFEWTGLASTFAYFNQNNTTYIAYCFKSTDSFSKFGTYEGNGTTEGPIVETGFEPAFIIIKDVDGSDNWAMVDNKRATTNPRQTWLRANLDNAEFSNTVDSINFYSNGFQIAGGTSVSNFLNENGNTFIYMAFAADPDTEAPTVAKSFSTVAYTGNSSTQSIEGLGFSPSLVWIKGRNNTYVHGLYDTIRGPLQRLRSNGNQANENVPNSLTSFDSDGFTLGSDIGQNQSGNNYVAWAWKADDNEPTINTEGSIDSIVSANANAGFSIVKLTGTGSAATIGHGLSAVPEMIIVKHLNGANDWWVYHKDLNGGTNPASYFLKLNTSDAEILNTSGSVFQGTSPTSTVFYADTAITDTGREMIAYCFHSVSGYSKIGSYTGTGSTGNVINVGFKPDFIMLKNIDSGTNGDGWFMFDSVRSGNPIDVNLQAHISDAESGPYAYTITTSSSGFEPTGSFANFTGTNASGNTYIYMAFKIN